MKYAIFVLAALIAAPAAAFDLKSIPSADSTTIFVSAPATIEFRSDGFVPNGPDSPNVKLPPVPAYSDGGPSLRFDEVCDEFGCRLELVGGIVPSHILASMDGGGLLPLREHRVARREDRGGFLRALLDRLFGGRGERVAARRDRRGARRGGP